MKETAEEHGFDKKKKLLLLLLLLTFAMFVFSFATTVPRETSEKRAHKTHNAHNTTVAQRWFFTGEILFSFFLILAKINGLGTVSIAKFEKNSKIATSLYLVGFSVCLWVCSQI
jgi:uncharacterized ion transporter superfamily protein YfcC